MEKDIWNLIINSYLQKPRDAITTPGGNRKGKWFHVSVEDNNVYISEAKAHHDSSTLKNRLRLNQNELETVYDLYLKYNEKIISRKEVRNSTWHSSYWFGIFSDLDL